MYDRQTEIRSRACGAPRRIAVAAAISCARTLLLGSCVAIVLATGTAHGDGYRLGVQDKIRVKAIEWRASKGEFQEWEALADDYTVNPAGAVSLPLVGEMPAEGKTTEELSVAISGAIQKRSGLLNPPGVSVEVIKFRPIYLVGEVERPGEYEFRPNLTVLQSIGIAGGLRRVTEAGLLRLERDRIMANGSHETARLELRRAIARRARLTAEQQGLNDIPLPREIASERDAKQLIADERALMNARADLLRSQLSGLADLKNLYEKEVRSLTDKMASLERQIGLAKRELGNISTLVQKGLSVSAREFTLEQTLSDLEGRMLDLQTASVRAQQESRKADRDAADLQNKRIESINADLQETRGNIDQFSAKLQTASELLDEATVLAPRLALERENSNIRTPLFSVIRNRDGKSVQANVDQNAQLEPGDVVRVDIISKGANSELRVGQDANQRSLNQ